MAVIKVAERWEMEKLGMEYKVLEMKMEEVLVEKGSALVVERNILAVEMFGSVELGMVKISGRGEVTNECPACPSWWYYASMSVIAVEGAFHRLNVPHRHDKE